MRTVYYLLLIITVSTLSTCKKNEGPITSSGTVEFDLNGVHHNFAVTGTYMVYDSVKSATLMSNSNNGLSMIAITVADPTLPLNVNYVSPGIYIDTFCNACKFFQLVLNDPDYGTLENAEVAADNITVSTTTGSRPVMSGNFTCSVFDPNGTTVVQITNGKINGVSY